MAVMQRGANVELTREVPNLRALVLGVRWNAGGETALDENLVVATLLCDDAGRVRSERDFVFFNQLASPELSVQQLTAALGDDNEQVEVDLAAVPAEITRIVVVVYVNDGPAQRRALGQLRSCVLRVLDAADNRELVASENLAEGLRTETALVLGEVYRHGSGWKFKVLGDAYSRGVAGILADYGLSA